MLYFIVGICCLAAGYFLGRHFGYEDGYEDGESMLSNHRHGLRYKPNRKQVEIIAKVEEAVRDIKP